MAVELNRLASIPLAVIRRQASCGRVVTRRPGMLRPRVERRASPR